MEFVGSTNTIDICLILSTIYIFIPVSGFVIRGPSALFFPGAIMLLRRSWYWCSIRRILIALWIFVLPISVRECLQLFSSRVMFTTISPFQIFWVNAYMQCIVYFYSQSAPPPCFREPMNYQPAFLVTFQQRKCIKLTINASRNVTVALRDNVKGN
jgi:hypothetical protein